MWHPKESLVGIFPTQETLHCCIEKFGITISWSAFFPRVPIIVFKVIVNAIIQVMQQKRNDTKGADILVQ